MVALTADAALLAAPPVVPGVVPFAGVPAGFACALVVLAVLGFEAFAAPVFFTGFFAAFACGGEWCTVVGFVDASVAGFVVIDSGPAGFIVSGLTGALFATIGLVGVAVGLGFVTWISAAGFTPAAIAAFAAA